MDTTELVLPKNDQAARDRMVRRVYSYISSLPLAKSFTVSFKEKKPLRSEQQNRYLWGVCYKELCKVLPGWDAEDVHEYMLGEWSGWELLDGLDRKRLRPVRRSSGLNKQEFADFVAFIQRKAAEHGCHIPDPQLSDQEESA